MPALVRAVPSTYLALVKEFPLVRIRNDKHLYAAHEMIDRLLRQDLDRGAQDYLDVLTDLVEDYEDEHIHIPDASEADVLRTLMESNGLTQSALAREVGMHQSAISAVLRGVRSLTKRQIVALARRFHVAPDVFLPAE